jgi:hypothetical protein
LYLEKNHPELGELSTSTQAAFSIGNQVGDLSHQLYGSDDSIMLLYEDGLETALKQTKALLDSGFQHPIFEATFQYDGVLVRVDVLIPDGNAWRIVEVKASTRVKKEHHLDLAIQCWVVQNLGYTISTASLAFINNGFEYPGDGDYQGLLIEEDLTERIDELQILVPSMIQNARKALTNGVPKIEIGGHCSSPYKCQFISHCWPSDVEYPITGLGGGLPKLAKIVLDGYCDIKEVPDDRVSGAVQQRIHQVTCSGKAEVLSGGREFVKSLEFPRYYLDFETIGPPVPIWPGTKPYKAVPIQWSCHIEDGPDDFRHEEFLDLSGKPPMRLLAEKMITCLGSRGPILMYTNYEQTVINTLIRLFPDLQTPLQALIDRLVDLHPPVKANYYHPKMLGSWSIKAVLPCIAPEMDYSNLEGIHEGMGASDGYLEAIHPDTTPERKAELEAQLLRYCKFDTEAMIAIVQFFKIQRDEPNIVKEGAHS